MTKEALKELLESYWYDKQYLAEKAKEIQSVQNLINKNNNQELFIDSKGYEESIAHTLIEKKKYVEGLIQELTQPYKTIFYLRYITFLTFDQIADRISYSTKRVYQLHSEGFAKLLVISSQKTKEY